MNFADYRILFTTEAMLDGMVQNIVETWEKH